MNTEKTSGLDLRKILIFFVRFVVVSLILYSAWMYIGKYYTLILAWCAAPLVALTGNSINIEQTVKATEEISLNPVVYISLVIAVRGVDWRDRLKPALIGLLLLTAASIAIIFLIFLSVSTGSEHLWIGTEFLHLTINFFLPILLWFLLMNKGDLFPISSSND